MEAAVFIRRYSKQCAWEGVIPTIENTVTANRSPIKRTPIDLYKAMGIFVMTVAILYFGKEVLMPVTLALLLAFALSPLVDLLRRRSPCPRRNGRTSARSNR